MPIKPRRRIQRHVRVPGREIRQLLHPIAPLLVGQNRRLRVRLAAQRIDVALEERQGRRDGLVLHLRDGPAPDLRVLGIPRRRGLDRADFVQVEEMRGDAAVQRCFVYHPLADGLHEGKAHGQEQPVEVLAAVVADFGQLGETFREEAGFVAGEEAIWMTGFGHAIPAEEELAG